MGTPCLKMADFENERKFTLRCLSQGFISVSVSLKNNNINTPKNITTIRRAEKHFMSEWIIYLNNILEKCRHQSETHLNNLNSVLDDQALKKHRNDGRIKGARHKRTLE